VLENRGSLTVRRVLGLLVSAAIVGAIIVACRPGADTGYVEIKTMPAASVAQTALYLDAAKLAPIRKGSAILRQHVGTLRLQSDGTTGSLTALCEIEVKKNRITSVTVSVLERPPRCQCRYGGADAARTCVS
jgi:hypothetical protein